MIVIKKIIEFSVIDSQEVKGLPNIKSAIKRVKVTKVKTLSNTIIKSALKTVVKKSKEAITTGSASATESVKNAVTALDKAAARNLIHKNTAARRKSKLTKALNVANK